MNKINAGIWSFSQLEKAQFTNESIYDLIVSYIENGTLKPGDKLPGYRRLAELLCINPTQIQRIYNRLEGKAWLQAKSGSGTYVTYNFPNYEHFYPEIRAVKWLPIPLAKPRLIEEDEGGDTQDFITIGFDMPDPQYVFEGINFIKTQKNHKDYKKNTQSDRIKAIHGDEFKAAILEYLNSKRSFLINANGLEVVLGRKECLQQVFNTLLKPGDIVVNTSPKDQLLYDILKTYKNVRAHVIPMNHSFLQELKNLLSHTKIKVLHLRPQCSCHESYILDNKVCIELLSLAIEHDFYIVEEDDYHEFWHEMKPFKPLICQDHKGHVIYCGAFSLIESYTQQTRTIVACEEFIELFQLHPLPISLFKDVIREQVIIELLANNKFRPMIERMQLEMNENWYGAFMQMDNALNKMFKLNKPSSGLSIWLEFPNEKELSELIAYLEKEGFQVPYFPGSQKPGPGVRNVRLGFATWDKDRAEEYSKAILDKFSRSL